MYSRSKRKKGKKNRIELGKLLGKHIQQVNEYYIYIWTKEKYILYYIWTVKRKSIGRQKSIQI